MYLKLRYFIGIMYFMMLFVLNMDVLFEFFDIIVIGLVFFINLKR